MATRSTIALEFADGTVGQIYCHWDGYLSNNGKILFESYQDPFKVRELIDLGDLSSLGPEMGVKHEFDEVCQDCTFYGRDRGETGIEARYFDNFEDYAANHQTEEFEYILRKDGRWYVSSYDTDGYITLAEAFVREQVMVNEVVA
jgi:hypothetical protein